MDRRNQSVFFTVTEIMGGVGVAFHPANEDAEDRAMVAVRALLALCRVSMRRGRGRNPLQELQGRSPSQVSLCQLSGDLSKMRGTRYKYNQKGVLIGGGHGG